MPTSCSTRSSSSSTTLLVWSADAPPSRSCASSSATRLRNNSTSSSRPWWARASVVEVGRGMSLLASKACEGGADVTGISAGTRVSAGGLGSRTSVAVASLLSSTTQKTQFGGAGGQEGSGCQPSGGAHPGGGTGQPGGVLNLLPRVLIRHAHLVSRRPR